MKSCCGGAAQSISSYLAEFERAYFNLNFDTLFIKVFEMLSAISLMKFRRSDCSKARGLTLESCCGGAVISISQYSIDFVRAYFNLDFDTLFAKIFKMIAEI